MGCSLTEMVKKKKKNLSAWFIFFQVHFPLCPSPRLMMGSRCSGLGSRLKGAAVGESGVLEVNARFGWI